jgi:hypothetical protein
MVMRRRSLAGLTGLAAVVALAACGGDDSGSGATSGTVPGVSDTTPGSSVPPSSAPPSTPPFSVTPLPSASSPSSQLPGTPMDPTLPLVADAVADLAGQLDISPGDVTVVAAREVTWPDGSLGCPEPGMMYTQALVDGTLVVLEANGQQYEYHGGTPLVLCENPKSPIGG